MLWVSAGVIWAVRCTCCARVVGRCARYMPWIGAAVSGFCGGVASGVFGFVPMCGMAMGRVWAMVIVTRVDSCGFGGRLITDGDDAG